MSSLLIAGGVVSVTANDSTQVGSTVTCHGCERNSNDVTNRNWHPLAELHCRTCHQAGHRACAECGKCLPVGHRWDRFYCSSTCRARAKASRDEAALERATWEAENPEEAAKQRAEFEAYVATLKVFADAAGVPMRNRRVEGLKARADRCAHETWKSDTREFIPCDKPFAPGDTIYRRAEHGTFGHILPYCAEHCCAQSAGRHNRDAPPGRYYPACRCLDGAGERKWMDPEPCASCGRMVRNDWKTANPYTFTATWTGAGERAVTVRTFCSANCRSAFSRDRARDRRRSKRTELICAVCHRRFAGRADGRHCSSACRQRAYRQRQAKHEREETA